MIRHDGDVIEEFIRHTAQFVDELYVFDNVSLDASVEIVRALQHEGLPVVLADCDIITTDGEWDNNNGLIRDVLRRSEADHLTLLDADEFIVAPSRAALEAELVALPPGAHALVRWRSYVPTVDDPQGEVRTLARIGYRLAHEPKAEEKTILSRALLEQTGATVALGSHTVVNAATRVLENVALAHFPVRSAQQIQAKALLGWSTYIAMGVDTPSLGFQWRRLYQELERKPTWSALDIFRYALGYAAESGAAAEEPPLVYAPLPPVPRRYVRPEQDLLEVAIALSRQLAQSTALLASRSRRLAAHELARAQIELRDRLALLERQSAVLAAERNAFEEHCRRLDAEAHELRMRATGAERALHAHLKQFADEHGSIVAGGEGLPTVVPYAAVAGELAALQRQVDATREALETASSRDVP